MLSAARRSFSAVRGQKRYRSTNTMSSHPPTFTTPLKTASYLLIGDEILSGTVKDTNGPFLAKYLRNRGIDLLRIEVIPDKVRFSFDCAWEGHFSFPT